MHVELKGPLVVDLGDKSHVAIEVLADDVPSAVAFYAHVFDVTLASAGNRYACDVAMGTLTLRVRDRAAHEQAIGHVVTPRPPVIGCRVLDVDGHLERAVQFGALPLEAEDDPATGRAIRDPYGLLWRLSAR